MASEKQNIHQDLKTALMLRGSSITKFARNLKKPDGSVGISHTAVIRVAKNFEETDWIRNEIEVTIRNSKTTFPEYWNQTAGA